MGNIKLIYGIDKSGKLVLAGDNSKSLSDSFFCPSCKENLTIAYEDIREPYFLHTKNANCDTDSILYETSKLLIKQSITDNMTGLSLVILKHSCHCCSNTIYAELPPFTLDSFKENITIDNNIFEFIVYRKNKTNYLAIKIDNYHESMNKITDNSKINWIKLYPENIMHTAHNWKPLDSNLKPKHCDSCKEVQNIVDNSKGKLYFYNPTNNLVNSNKIARYVAYDETCFSCKKRTPIYWWEGVPFCESEPPEQRPKTIKYKYSHRYGGAYWANTCTHCGIIQGDNHLYILDNAPFKDLPLFVERDQNDEYAEVETFDPVSGLYEVFGIPR